MAITAAQLNVRFGTEGVAKTKGDIDSVGDAVNKADQKRKLLGAGFLGLGGIVAGAFTVGVGAAVNFEQAMANVGAVAGATEVQFAALSDTALRIGADTSFSATEAAGAIEELAKAGVGIEDILLGAADGTAALAAAAGVDMPTAATAMANSMNVFSLAGDQATRVANVFAAAANKSATDVHQLQMGLAQGGAQFAMFGMSLEESVGALSLFADYGIRGSDAATSINAALRTMSSGVGVSADAMADLGISMYDANGQFVGLDGLAQQLQTTLGGLTEEERNLAIAQLGGADGMRALNILYEEGAAGVNEYTDAVTGTSAASEAAAIRMDTVNGAIEALKGSVETLFITFMSGLLPGIKAVVRGLTGFTNFLTKLPKPVQTAIVAFTALIGIVAGVVGAFLLFGSQIAAVIGIVSGVIPVILAVVAAVAALYYAWDRNLFGIRDITQNAASAILGFLEPITDFLGGFTDAWNDTSEAVYQWGDTVDDIIPTMDLGERALRAFSAGLLAIGGDDTPAWLVDLAFGFDRLADSLQAGGLSGFVSQLGTELRNLAAGIDIGSVAVNIGGWIINAASDLWDTVTSWIMGGYSGAGDGTGGAGGGRAGIPIGAVLVKIQDWTVDAVVNLGQRVFSWIQSTAIPAINKAAFTLGIFAVTIADWTVTAAVNLGQRVFSWIQSVAIPGINKAAFDLGIFAVKVADWAVSEAIEIKTRVVEWAKAGVSGAQDIGSVTLAVGSIIWQETADIFSGLAIWAAGMIGLQDFSSVSEALAAKFRLAIGGMFTAGQAAGGGLNGVMNFATQLMNWLTEQITGANVEGLGEAIGEKLATAVGALFVGGVGMEVLKTAFTDGVIASIEGISILEVAGAFVTMMNAVMLAPVRLLKGLFKGLWNGLTDGLAGQGARIQAILYPILNKVIDGVNRIIDALNSIPGFDIPNIGHLQTDLEQMKETLISGTTAAMSMSDALSALKPPGLAAYSEEVQNLLKGLDEAFESGSFREQPKGPPAPPNRPGDYSVLPIGGEQLASTISVNVTGAEQAIAALGTIKAAMADTASGANILKSAITSIGTATFTGPLAGLQSLKAAMAEAQTASGALKIAIDSIGGGGQAATGDVKGAGGGGPFASLLAGIVSAQAQLATFVQTTIALMAGWQTGMVTIVAGFGAAITTSLSAPLMASLAVFASFAQSTIALMAGWGTGIRTIVTSTMAATSAAVTSGMASSRAAVQAGMAAIAASAATGMAAFRNAVAAGMASSVAAVRSGVAQMVGVARAAAGSMAGAGQAIGRSLGQGIASGISSMIGSVAAAAANIVRAAVSAARSAGGISSPSTIMRDEVGKMLGLGAIIGVQSMIPDMMRTMADLVAIPSIAPDTANRSLAMNGGYGGSGSGGYGQGGGTTIVNHHYHYSATVTVQGDVTTERRLTSNIAREIWTTEAEELRRGKIAAGVMSS